MLPDSEYFDHLSTPSNHPRPVVLSRAAISSGHHFLRSIRSVGLEPNADRFGSHPFRWTHISAVMTPAYATQFDSNHIRSASTSTRTAPVDDQLPPRRSPQRRFIVLPVLRQFFHNFFCYHVGITFRSRSLVVFFQLRSVSCAPFTPTFADGVVQRSLALYLPCFVSLCSPVWPRAISHRSSSIFHHGPIILCSLPR